MTDIYLKTTSLEDFKAELPMFFQDGELITATHQYALDWVGLIVDTPSVMDAEMNIIQEPTFLSGEHVNIRFLDDSLADEIKALPLANTTILDPEPKTPARVWA